MKSFRISKVNLKGYQIHLIVFILFVIIGSIYTNLFLIENTDKYSLLIDSLIEKLDYTDVMKARLFEYVLVHRIKVFLLIWAAGFIAFTKQINTVLTAYFGISLGVLLSVAMISKGFKLYILILLLHLPQYLVYVPLYVYLIFSNVRFSAYLYDGKKTFRRSKFNNQAIFEYILVLVITILVVVIGVFLESFVNVDIIRWYAGIMNK